jgi:hypothetical protein
MSSWREAFDGLPALAQYPASEYNWATDINHRRKKMDFTGKMPLHC